MTASDIRNTITILEKVGMEYVANRDFDLVKKAEKNGKTYALGMHRHEDTDVKKADYDVYQLQREGGFEYAGRFYPQEFYTEVARLDLSPYVGQQEAVAAFDDWLKQQ